MAILTKSVLGKVSGALGDITFRQRNGLNYVATRPSNFTPPSDADSVARRDRFAFACKLAANIISIPNLKILWGAEAVDGKSVYNTIIGTNYRFISADSITDMTYLSPGIGFLVKPSHSEIKAEGVNLVLDPIGSNAEIDIALEKSVQLTGIISLSDPIDNTVDDFALIPLASAELQLSVDTSQTFSIAFSTQESQLFQKFRISKVMFALITIDVNGSPVHYSSTFKG
jgi:hypothetical protein